jgi:hypothetical protein
MEPIGRGEEMPSATNTGKINCRGRSWVSAIMERIAGVVRSRLGLTTGMELMSPAPPVSRLTETGHRLHVLNRQSCNV